LLEGLDDNTLLTLEAAAVVHDSGIKVCEQKYERQCKGDLQELEGLHIAMSVLADLSFSLSANDCVAYLVWCHHTFTDANGLDSHGT